MTKQWTRMRSNENKMSDGGRERASLAVEVRKSSQKWSVRRSAVRSIAWLDESCGTAAPVSQLMRFVRLEILCLNRLLGKIRNEWLRKHSGLLYEDDR